jgi:steroid 5-alpha reductase family enzyme
LQYFGEIVLWFGLLVSAFSSFSGVMYVAVLSPVFVALLLTRVSGIPILEKSGKKRWGSDPAYNTYVKKTAVLIPYVW